ncbi:hypothetical protein [Alicyclobacillus fastidiosus]|uniref:Uncharacterized protein n=1 Tax=Alicyclobacillus fastidiosus TaxID=392011 RepID=A0ABV5AJZ0_9BACL|nr:hypothetical protein [Alicyclobacillus fastidiosus]WEH11118.1 hypothetical protein PYS47_07840 [Alicyclobacillus fastidiosus]
MSMFSSSVMNKDSLVWGSDGHLSQADKAAIHDHFSAIIGILQHAGMDRVHIVEFLHGLLNNWWVDMTIHVCSALAEVVGI